MSEDVTPAAFERQRSVLLSLLESISVSESNCPTGARVAVVGYSADTKYLIRFQDYHRKTQLMESVRNIALERTSNRRQLGAAMRFVGQNVFKRVRAGMMMRKVAVFLSNGPSADVGDIVTAVMEYRAVGIVPAVISLRNAPAVGRAMEVGLLQKLQTESGPHPSREDQRDIGRLTGLTVLLLARSTTREAPSSAFWAKTWRRTWRRSRRVQSATVRSSKSFTLSSLVPKIAQRGDHGAVTATGSGLGLVGPSLRNWHEGVGLGVLPSDA